MNALDTALNVTTIRSNDLTAIETAYWSELGAEQPFQLGLNELPFDLPQGMKQQLADKLVNMAWNRYPNARNSELAHLIATAIGVESTNIILGNGSSALIQQIVSCFSKIYGQAVVEKPTFGFYHQVCANERLPYLEWALTEDGIYEVENFPHLQEPTLVLLTSPNNPMGTTLAQKDLCLLLAAYPESIFMVDEAYAEFRQQSVVSLTHEYSNLLVLKTFSKAYGLPGLRLGYVVGSRAQIQLLNAYTIPFAINIFTELIVREIFTNPEFEQAIRLRRERVTGIRDFTLFLLQELAGQNQYHVYPSDANFLLLRFINTDLYQSLKALFEQRAIRVSYPMPSSIRITIGTEAQMQQIVRLIKHMVAAHQQA